MQTIKGYEFIEKIYQNPTNQIWRAMREIDHQSVIIKLPQSQHPTNNEIAAIDHEYSILKNLHLPGVIELIDFYRDDYYPALVFADQKKISLAQYINNKALDLNNFFTIALQLTQILLSLHKKHVIHKDIKPANILIDPTQLLVTLTDFSSATKFKTEAAQSIDLEGLAGTLAYMSPEQTGRMNRPIDYRTDIYSLGITFYEMLAGKPPFTADKAAELIYCHIARLPPYLLTINPSLPKTLAEIVAKMLAKEPEARYQNLASLKADIQACAKMWQENHTISDFQIAKEDTNDNLIISSKLYGREKEVQILLDMFKQTSEGKANFLLIGGYSGEGKTALINEIQKPVTRENGYFVTGKYDQLNRSTPLSGIIYAFDQLLCQELTKPESQLTQLKAELLKNLGRNGKILTDMLPKLELIIGKQPPVPDVNPIENRNRFVALFQNFIRIFATTEHPLVIFLDDLQWADAASLNLIDNILNDKNINCLLIIGAYRDNEISPPHPLLSMIQDLQNAHVRIETLHLCPLTLANIKDLLSDTLHLPDNKIESLAELTYNKTNGNVFFIRYFLSTLYQKKLIKFNHKKMCWQWDVDKIKNQHITNNVVDLLLTQIEGFSEDLQEILSISSCIGFKFDWQTLKIITNKNDSILVKQLKALIQQNFIIPMDETIKLLSMIEASNDNTSDKILSEEIKFQFGHDRIYQASYELLSYEERQELHIKIARLLLAKKPLNENDERLFVITDHFYQGSSLITNLNEKADVARYSLWAGSRAKISNAYQIAFEYFTKGIEMLGENAWKNDYSLSFALHRNRLDSLYLLTQSEQNDYFNDIIKHTRTNIEKSELYFMKIRTYTTIQRHDEAIVTAIEALKLFNFHLPLHVNKLKLILKILSVNSNLKKFKIEEIAKWGKPADENTNIIIKTLSIVLVSLYFKDDQNLYAYSICQGIELIFTKGYSPDSSSLLAGYAMILVHVLQQYDLGLKVITSIKYLESQSYQSHNYARNKLLLGIAEMWFTSLINGANDIKECSNESFELGDLAYASYAQVYTSWYYFAGIPLIKLSKISADAVAIQQRLKNLDFLTVASLQMSVCDNWLGKNNDIEAITTAFAKSETLPTGPRIGCCLVYSQFLYSIGDNQKALPLLEELIKHKVAATGSVFYYHGIFYYGLILAKLYPKTVGFKRLFYYFKLKSILRQTQKWAKQYPPNFAFMYYWLAAEIMQHSAKNKEDVMALYDQAAQAAKSSNFIHYYAWINESAGAYLISQHFERWAKYYVQESYYAFQQWGAAFLMKRLADKYPESFVTQSAITTIENSLGLSNSKTINAIDFDAVMNASNAISKEISLTVLLRTLATILIKYTGAQNAAILFKDKDQLHVLAQAENKNKETIDIEIEDILLDKVTNLPKSIIDYVQRTNEHVILNEPNQFEPFSQDPYLKIAHPKSLLCVPIMQTNRVVCYIYLENRLSTYMFTPEHIHVFELLAGQVGISIENARLYDSTNRFVPKPLMKILNKTSVLELNAGECVDKIMSVMFADIRHFTTLSEAMTAKQTFFFVNEYINCMSPIIRKHNGFIVQYLGDAILSLFPNNSDDAIKAALEMELALNGLNQKQKEMDRPLIDISYGINTGNVMVGLLGEPERIDTSVISDAINLASRIQGLNQIYHTNMLMSNLTFESLANPSQFNFRIIDKVRVKGRLEPTYIYEILPNLLNDQENARKIQLQAFNLAFTKYEQNHFSEAVTLFTDYMKRYPDDNSAKIIHARCDKFMKEGVPPGWDGTYTLLEK